MYICKSCGMTYATQIRFCSYCGNHVIEANNPANYPPPGNQNQQYTQTQFNTTSDFTPNTNHTPVFQGQSFTHTPNSEPVRKVSAATKVFGFIGMALGILGLVLFFIIITSFPDDIMFMPPSFPIIAFAASLAGWIISGTSRNHGFNSAVTKAGKILSIFATILNTLSLIIALILGTHL